MRCGHCREAHELGHPYLGGSIFGSCWLQQSRIATSGLADRVTQLFPGAGTVTATRAIVSALPAADDRVRAWFDLGVMAGPRRRGLAVMTPGMERLLRELKQWGVPRKMFRGLQRTRQQTREKASCSQCGAHRQIAGRVDGRGLCAACWQQHPSVVRPCPRCGDVAYLGRVGLCAGCRSADRLAQLFTSERLDAHPEWAKARDSFAAADRRYLARATNKPAWKLLAQLVAGPDTTNHAALDALGTPRATRTLREFLIATGVLPERDERLHSFEHWVDSIAAEIVSDADRLCFVRFARWRHLRRSRTEPMSAGQSNGRRHELHIVFAFIHWVNARDLTLRTARQSDLEAWLAEGTTNRRRIVTFTRWCRTSSINRTLDAPPRVRSLLMAGPQLSEDLQLDLLRRVLTPGASIPSELRLAAGLVLLYGIRSHRIAQLRTADILMDGARVAVRLANEPLDLPEPLARHARDAAEPRTFRRFGGPVQDDDWLFPSPLPGRPITAASLAARLRHIGVQPANARSTALAQLALQVPPAVLSRLIGVQPRTATRWNGAAAGSQARYAATKTQRRPTTPTR